MGNHDVGSAFASVFESIAPALENMSRADILSRLDNVGERFRGTDAEFDDYTDSSHPFGEALIKAFAPEDFPIEPGQEATQEESEDWQDAWRE